MRTIAAIILFCLIVCVPIATYASDLDDADYYGVVLITNNGTATTNVTTNMSINTTAFINSEYIDDELEGVAIITSGGTDAIFMPGYQTNPWCIWVDSISANSSLNYTLYTSNSDNLSCEKYYFPGSGGMTVSDNETLELSNTKYRITLNGYFTCDGGGAVLINKSSSMSLLTNTSNQITFTMLPSSSTCTADITPGEHKIDIVRESTGSGNVTIEIDDVYAASVAVGANGHADNANDWIFADWSPVDYIDYIEVEIDGTLAGKWEWEYGATFTDQSANDNTATPVFRTTSFSLNTSLTTFEPLNPAEAPAYTVEDAPDFYTGNITATGNFTTSTLPDASFPGADVIEDVTSSSGTPEIWLWGIIGIVTISLGGVGVSYARKKYSIGGGYVTVIIILALLVFGFLVTFGKFDWWMIWFYIITAAGLAVASRHIDLGGATSTHGMIGFLAMTWIGLTLINRILEGALLTSSETSFLNTVSFTQAFNVLGIFTIPIINFSFFTQGIPSLLRWDYSYFGGQAQIIQYMMYSITAVVSFIIFGLILGLVYQYFSRLR